MSVCKYYKKQIDVVSTVMKTLYRRPVHHIATEKQLYNTHLLYFTYDPSQNNAYFTYAVIFCKTPDILQNNIICYYIHINYNNHIITGSTQPGASAGFFQRGANKICCLISNIHIQVGMCPLAPLRTPMHISTLGLDF